MDIQLKQLICETCGAQAVSKQEHIQALWSDYGELSRLYLAASRYPSVILKHIRIPEQVCHPKGWQDDIAHQRKLRSYQVEMRWYQRYAPLCHSPCELPQLLLAKQHESNMVLLLSDLNTQGFSRRIDYQAPHIPWPAICAGLRWLAYLHANFMQQPLEDLWSCGGYWHLATRPNEWQAMADGSLKQSAKTIDALLQDCPYQTAIHGDAKVANFCFSEDGQQAAAVDFQYVGRGCGMKDVAYFISSCIDDRACFTLEQPVLDYYFEQLHCALAQYQPQLDSQAIELCWREYYSLAWADFQRFLQGWSPDHWKLGDYSNGQTEQALFKLPHFSV